MSVTEYPPSGPDGLTEAHWDKAVGVLRDCPEAVLACHLSPDADALGRAPLTVSPPLRASPVGPSA